MVRIKCHIFTIAKMDSKVSPYVIDLHTKLTSAASECSITSVVQLSKMTSFYSFSMLNTC